MPPIQRSQRLLQKAEAALLAALEVYNKPDFRYREETFAILAVNAWELLLKARLLLLSNNDPKCLWVYERRRNREGQPTKKLYKRRNRSKNPQTLSLVQTTLALARAQAPVPPAVLRNITGLVEIRDNAVHYLNPGALLAKQVLEIGTAAVTNFVRLAREWFGQDLRHCNLYLMPIGFLQPPAEVNALVATSDEKHLIEYLAGLMKAPDIDPADPLQVALSLDISLKRSSSPDGLRVTITTDPDAPRVQITEEDAWRQFPWDYDELTKRCRVRFIGFKTNQRYHEIRRELAKDPKLCRARVLDPRKPGSGKKEYFSPNILLRLDESYTKG